MGKKVACSFDACPARIPIEDFDEDMWLPVFKATREHWGFLCPDHVQAIRDGKFSDRYLLSHAGSDELIIDSKPLAAHIDEPDD